MKLNLGCGNRTLPGWWNVDWAPGPGVNHIFDLNQDPWPWEDASAELIEARDIFEHVDDPILFVVQCHRILAPGGRLHVHTPYWRHPDAYTDPTHKRFPTEHTFDYWIPGTVLYREHNAAYGGVAFSLVDVHIDGGSLDFTFLRS